MRVRSPPASASSRWRSVGVLFVAVLVCLWATDIQHTRLYSRRPLLLLSLHWMAPMMLPLLLLLLPTLWMFGSNTMLLPLQASTHKRNEAHGLNFASDEARHGNAALLADADHRSGARNNRRRKTPHASRDARSQSRSPWVVHEQLVHHVCLKNIRQVVLRHPLRWAVPALA